MWFVAPTAERMDNSGGSDRVPFATAASDVRSCAIVQTGELLNSAERSGCCAQQGSVGALVVQAGLPGREECQAIHGRIVACRPSSGH